MVPTESVRICCGRGSAVTCATFLVGSMVSNEREALSRYIVKSAGIAMRCADGILMPELPSVPLVVEIGHGLFVPLCFPVKSDNTKCPREYARAVCISVQPFQLK